MKKKIIDMRKGIATQTILLMLIGIIVVGILIYIVYRIVTTQSLSEEQCRARWINQCMMCKNINWQNTGGPPSSLLTDCAKGIFAGWNDNTNCQAGSMQAECKQLGVE